MNIQFGNRLKELRIERELSQGELAKHFNTGKSTISNYENKNRLPDVNTIAKYAEFFDVTLDYIMGKSDNRKNDSITVYPPEYFENALPQNIIIDSQTKKLFTERAKFRMVDEDLTKDTLAKKTGITKDLISKYLNGKSLPDIKTLKKLASALNTTSDYLLGINDNSSPNEITLIENWVVFSEGSTKRKIPTKELRNFIEQYLKENPDE
jgi:transcriptional regulator with XRE-family HTH domain